MDLMMRRRVIQWNLSKTELPLVKQYLTFEALEDTRFSIVFTSASRKYITRAMRESFSYSIDNGRTWVTFETPSNTYSGTALTTPTIHAGEKVLWKGIGTQNYVSGSSLSAYCYFTSSGEYIAYGNMMSIIYGNRFINKYDLENTNSGLAYFFYNNSLLISAQNLILPATTLAERCYSNMFSGCVNLTTAPELPATVLKLYCYSDMFSGCISLTVSPELPATTLANYCYYKMFSGCISLTTAPELLATTLADYCYHYMFYGCTSLITAPELPATTLASGCYKAMFQGCTSLTTAPELPATTLVYDCYRNMFSNCTGLTTAPELPATTLAGNCYLGMFYKCTSLMTVPELPAITLTNGCYSLMFEGCTSLTTTPELPATTLVNQCYVYMFKGCSSLNYIKAMFTTEPSTSYTNLWVSNVSATGTFVKNNAATWDVTGSSGVPSGWTIETASE